MLYELVEYTLHRYLHKRTNTRAGAHHTRHHAKHCDSKFEYPVDRALAGAVQVLLTCTALVLTYSSSSPLVVYGAAGVLSYNACHWGAHVLPNSRLGRYHRAHHANSRCNFGVGSPLGDVLGGTLSSKFHVSRAALLLLPPPLAFAALDEREPRF